MSAVKTEIGAEARAGITPFAPSAEIPATNVQDALALLADQLGDVVLPSSAAPTVNADGEIAVDTSVADFSHGLIRFYGGEEQFIISVPVAALASPVDGRVLAYNATNDEFELVSPTAGSGVALTSNSLAQFAATTSAELRGVLSDETGTGAAVFATSPTLVTPILGTPTSGTLTNCTGLPTIIAANEASDTTCFPAFFTAATGELGPKTNSNLTYDASTGAFSIGTSAPLTAGTIELGAASDTTISRTGAGAIAVEGVGVALNSTSLAHTAGTIELGHASDTTLSRPAAGVLAVEGTIVKMVGTDTIWIPAGAMKPKATNGAGSGTYDSGSNDVTFATMDFDTTTQEQAHTLPIGMPKSWNEGTVAAVFYWTNTGGSSTQTVRWSIAGAAFSDDDPLNVTFSGSQSVDDTWLAQNDLHISSATSAITIGGTPAENDQVIFEITRVVSSDNLSGDANLIGVKILFTTNAANDT